MLYEIRAKISQKKIVKLLSWIYEKTYENGFFFFSAWHGQEKETCVAIFIEQCTEHIARCFYCCYYTTIGAQQNVFTTIRAAIESSERQTLERKMKLFCHFSHSICWFYLHDRQSVYSIWGQRTTNEWDIEAKWGLNGCG